MSWTAVAVAAVLLSLERILYVIVWRDPDAFQRWCAHSRDHRRDPVTTLAWIAGAFKVLQVAVFLWWCVLHGGVRLPGSRSAWAVAAGALLIAGGQALNASVFYRLGVTGVFYGNRFGHHVPWCNALPFSMLRHPQYVGVVLSIWGFFLIARFPHPDWFVLPLLESAYYAIGACLERDPREPRYGGADQLGTTLRS